MAPNSTDNVAESIQEEERFEKLIAPQARPKKFKILYVNIIYFSFWHIASLYGLYLCFTSAKWATIIFAWFMYVMGMLGITAGSHRLWSHRSYKAKMPLQIILMVMSTIAFQNTVFSWVRDHRLHHKHSDTDGDPHNSTRGFFFAHIGWLLVGKDPEVRKRGKYIDMSDIYNNPVLKFQKKYAVLFISTVCFILPTIIPMYFWGETLNVAWHVALLRYMLNLHGTLLVNSVAHAWGFRRYDKNIKPAQSYFTSFCSLGEGFHNYHHVFPWDYRAAELGNNFLNLTTKFIDFFAWIGWAYDLKAASDSMIEKRIEATGDGTDLWGWGDSNMKDDLVKDTEIFYAKKESNMGTKLK